jgi:hypothetical protein
MCKSLVFGLVAKMFVYGDPLSPQSPALVAGALRSRLFGPSSEADSFCLWHFLFGFLLILPWVPLQLTSKLSGAHLVVLLVRVALLPGWRQPKLVLA